MSVKQDKVRLVCKRTDGKGSYDFALELNSYIKQGYTILESDQVGEAPSFGAIPHFYMVKDIVEVEEVAEVAKADPADIIWVETNPLAELETTTKKADLLAFAKKHNIEVPEDLKYPPQISKYLKEKLSQE